MWILFKVIIACHVIVDQIIIGAGRSGRTKSKQGQVVLLSTKLDTLRDSTTRQITYGTTDGCLRKTCMDILDPQSLPCPLRANAVFCDNCQHQAITKNNLEMHLEISQVDTSCMNAYMTKLEEIGTALDNLLQGPSYWFHNCLLCFLVGSITNNNECTQLHFGHKASECINPMIETYCSCNTCLDVTLHPGSLFCNNYISEDVEGICFNCLLPQKLGTRDWYHTRETFGPSNCVNKSVLRLLWVCKNSLTNKFRNGTLGYMILFINTLGQHFGDNDQKLFVKWLSSLHDGVPMSVVGYLFLVEKADSLLEKST